MHYKNTLNVKDIFAKFFIISYVFISTLQIENSLYIPTDYCFYHSQIEIELVLSEKSHYDISFYNLNTSQKQTKDFTLAAFDFPPVNKCLLIQYNNLVLHQLKSLEYNFYSNHRHISILQKNNIWHQSSDEDSFLFS